MKRITDTLVGLLIGAFFVFFFNPEVPELKKENKVLLSTNEEQALSINVLLRTLQSEEAYLYTIPEEEGVVEIDDFVGVLFWMKTDGAFANAPEVLEGSETVILQHATPHRLKVTEGATGYLLQGKFF